MIIPTEKNVLRCELSGVFLLKKSVRHVGKSLFGKNFLKKTFVGKGKAEKKEHQDYEEMLLNNLKKYDMMKPLYV
ncbi:MAG: hypothetical protein E7655_00605 [Ruminococcaceae bacterium]|nr:hypothetical protein [Oscillospiraceae bacterium]